MITFRWKHRKHPAACAENVPLLDALVELYDLSTASVDAAVAAGEQPKAKMHKAYSKAIDSIAKYPMRVGSVEEAQELAGSQITHTHWRTGCWIL